MNTLQEKLRKVMSNMQQLLPLLTVCVSSHESTNKAIAELKTQFSQSQACSEAVEQHMGHIHATISMMSTESVTAADVNTAVSTIQESTLQLSEAAVTQVHSMCTKMQMTLGESVDTIVFALDNMQTAIDSFTSRMLTMQSEMRSDLKEIKENLAEICFVSPDDLQGFGSRLVFVCAHPASFLANMVC